MKEKTLSTRVFSSPQRGLHQFSEATKRQSTSTPPNYVRFSPQKPPKPLLYKSMQLSATSTSHHLAAVD